MVFYHEYIDLDTYFVRGSDGRIWDKTDELYLDFCKSYTPKNMSGNEFVIIVDGVVTIDPNKDAIIAQRQADIAAKLAEKQAITDTITTNLPSWSQVETSISNISNLADAKVFLEKLSKVVYHHIKGTTDGS